ncbi:helix-turn-helix transcriptional regulator, partial [Jatrophihabitans sp. YIM 134969]
DAGRWPDVAVLPESSRARVAIARRLFLTATNRLPVAVRGLTRAAALLVEHAPAEARRTHLEAAYAGIWAGGADAHLLNELVTSLPRTDPAALLGDPDADVVDLVLAGLRVRIVEGYAAAAPLLRRAVDAVRTEGDASGDTDSGTDAGTNWGTDGREPLARSLPSLPVELWDEPAWRRAVTQQVDDARARGALTVLPPALRSLAWHQVATGDLAGADLSVAEADAVADATGAAHSPATDLVVAAWRGDDDRADTLAELVREPDAAGRRPLAYVADHADAVRHNAAGRGAAALACSWPVFLRDHVPSGPLVVSEVVDAASRTGDRDVLTTVGRWLAERETSTPGDWVEGVAERVRALLADDDRAEAHHLGSVERLDRTALRIEQARSRLAYGEWLRRRGRRADARRVLAAALAQFEAIGAVGFAGRARREFDATGHAGARTRTAAATLTAQESQIALLARSGLSNPEIGERLFISRRTVQYHLRKVFIKLDITSREHLARAFAEDVSSVGPVGSGR